MPCYHPITAYRSTDGAVFFEELRRHGDLVETLQVPCGRCEGCLQERARQWSIRIVHEASLHEANAFVTLTYDDEHLPEGGNLRYADFQEFMKRLRKKCGSVRYFVAGEYGSQTLRPHFHACLFGVDFPDKVLFRSGGSGAQLFTSRALDSIWRKGFGSIGEVSQASARYCAQYVLGKREGRAEALGLVPEMMHCSLRPGIGAEWIKKYFDDVYPQDFVVVDGIKMKPPRFYDKKFKERYTTVMEDDVMYSRVKRGKEKFAESSEERLAVREQVDRARRTFFSKRGL